MVTKYKQKETKQPVFVQARGFFLYKESFLLALPELWTEVGWEQPTSQFATSCITVTKEMLYSHVSYVFSGANSILWSDFTSHIETCELWQ